jgi:hypothetical protein
MVQGNGISLRRRIANGVMAMSVLLSVAACSVPEKFSMYPTALDTTSLVAEDVAVVLVGNAGPATIDYLQFSHSSLPAINARGIELRPGEVVAIPIPIGIKELSLQTYTTASGGAGYLPNGMSYGYIPVRTPKIDITSRGAYYLATILPDQQQNFTAAPDAAPLKKFANTHPQIAKLRSINFNWPK